MIRLIKKFVTLILCISIVMGDTVMTAFAVEEKTVDYEEYEETLEYEEKLEIEGQDEDAGVEFEGTEEVESSNPVPDIVKEGYEELVAEPVGDATYSLRYRVENEKVTIIGCTGTKSGDLVIPDSIDGYPVTAIGDSAFYDSRDLFDGVLVLPSNIEKIGRSAFNRCWGLSGELVLPDSLKEIDGAAFAGCKGFTGDLIIPDAITTIRFNAFDGCENFNGKLALPEGLETIESKAFYKCSGLTGKLIFPSSVKEIGAESFYYCSGFSELVLPDSLTEIERSSFGNCYGFRGDLIIPDTVTSVGEDAFWGCGFDGKLKLSNSITVIKKQAFYGCSKLTGILVIPASVETIEDSAFYGCYRFSGDLVIPDSVTNLGASAFGACSGFNGELDLPNKLCTINAGTFRGCSGFSGDLNIPDSVSTIWAEAFSGCSGFKGKLIISSKVSTIGEGAFRDCSGFSGDLVIPDAVGQVPKNAFRDCSGFDGKLVLPNSMAFGIGDYAFRECSGLTGKLVLPDTLGPIGSGAFSFCSGLEGTLVIPDNVSFIGYDIITGTSISTVDNKSDKEVNFNEEEYWYDETSGNRVFSIKDGVAVKGDSSGPPFCRGGEATCISGAICDICGKPYGEIDSSNHVGGTEIKNDRPATCYQEGNTGDIFCESCHEKLSDGEIIVKISHTPDGSVEENAFEGTCIALGHHDEVVYCKVEECKEELSRLTVDDGYGSHRDADFDGLCDYCGRAKYTVENPMFSITSGEVEKGSKVAIATSTSDATIYYSTDGNNPVIADENIYQDAIVINEPVTIKAIAVKERCNDSEVVSATYTIKDESDDWGDISEEDKSGFTDANDISTNLWVKGVDDTVYTGKAVTQADLRVYSGKKLLSKGTDYTVAYKNNTKAGIATITVTGKGNYAGTIVKTFEIRPIDLSLATADDIVLAFNNKVQKGTTTVTVDVNGAPAVLKANTDFKYIYPNTDSKAADFDADAFKVADDYIVTVEGKGNFTGTATFTETITTKPLISKMTVKGVVAKMPYTGSAITQDNLEVWNGKTPLEKGTDYTVSYDNNTKVGKATVEITGKGEYVGTKTVTFEITGISISKMAVDYDKTFGYDGTAIEPTVRVYQKATRTTDEVVLTKGTHYNVDYDANVNAGKKATVIITGINGYTGTIRKTFTINPKAVNTSADITVSLAPATYLKGGSKPAVTVKDGAKTLKEGTDYTVAYKNNTKVGEATATITGKGNYKGAVPKTFTIAPSSISNVEVTATDVVYQNKAGICKPKLTVTDTDGKALTAGTDYEKTITYTYAKDALVSQVLDAKKKTYKEVVKEEGSEVDLKNDIIPIGVEIRVTVTGKGNYPGTTYTTFRFVKSDISKANVTVKPQNYTGKAIELSKDDITVKVGTTVLKKTDYEIVGYSKNTAKGNAEVTIRGLGNYGGTKIAKFTISARSMNYTVVYEKNADDATGVMKNSVIALNGKVTANAFKRPGHIFLGWSFEPAGEVEIINKGNLAIDNPNEYGSTINLYAQWK